MCWCFELLMCFESKNIRYYSRFMNSVCPWISRRCKGMFKLVDYYYMHQHTTKMKSEAVDATRYNWKPPMPLFSVAALVGMTLLAVVAYTHWDNPLLTPIRRYCGPPVELQTLFVVACCIHLIEAVYAADLCVQSGNPRSAPAWFASVTMVGYGSLRILLKQQKAQHK